MLSLKAIRERFDDGVFRAMRHRPESDRSASGSGNSCRPYWYLGGRRALIKLHNGLPFVVDTDSLDITTSLITVGRWEPWIEDVLATRIVPGSTIVDVGANMGYYSVVGSTLAAPNYRVFSFEPNPRLYSILQTNIFINGIVGQTFDTALGSSTGTAILWNRPDQLGGGFLRNDDKREPGYSSTTVQVTTLDNALPKDLFVDLLKIDVEGFEPDVLEGATDLLSRSENIKIICEITPNAWRQRGHDPQEVLWKLVRSGFKLSLLLSVGPTPQLTPQLLVAQAAALNYVTCFLAERK